MNRLKKWCFLMLLLAPLALQAATKYDIDHQVNKTLKEFFKTNPQYDSLADKAYGFLVFPSISKAGLIVGGEYGEGALMKESQVVDYYSTMSASIGLQIGSEVHTEIIMFMNKEGFDKFQAGAGFSAGVEGSLAVMNKGEAKVLSTNTVDSSVLVFVYGNKGFMGNLSVGGSKYTKLAR
jgi:lipid-binding SYLF domain-containing protein